MLSKRCARMCALLPAMMTVFMVSSCRHKGYDYQASAVIAGINLEVGLSQRHPFLAEYARSVLIDDGMPIAFGYDSGGKAFVNVFETPSALILQTFHTHVLIVDKATKVASTEQRPLTQAEIDSFAGAFEFVDIDTYQFVEAHENHIFDPAVVKGG